MIFWITWGIAAAIVVVLLVLATVNAVKNRGRSFYSYNYTYPDFGDAAFASFITLVVAAVVSILLLPVTALFSHSMGEQRTVTRELRAISTATSTDGRFYFLGGGYIKDRRVLNYIVKQDGYSSLDYEFASDARIYEDTEEPTVTQYYQYYGNEWITPWPLGHTYSVDFHIPEGSVLEDFSVTP